jgi:hypothetical protein
MWRTPLSSSHIPQFHSIWIVWTTSFSIGLDLSALAKWERLLLHSELLTRTSWY